MSDIKKCKPYYKYTCVSKHFNLYSHIVNNLKTCFFKFYVILDNIFKENIIKQEEIIINIFKCIIGDKLLNEDIPNLDFI